MALYILFKICRGTKDLALLNNAIPFKFFYTARQYAYPTLIDRR